jgi:hypothetical protein
VQRDMMPFHPPAPCRLWRGPKAKRSTAPDRAACPPRPPAAAWVFRGRRGCSRGP